VFKQGAAVILQELESALLRTLSLTHRGRSNESTASSELSVGGAASTGAGGDDISPAHLALYSGSTAWNPYLEVPVLPRFSEEAFLKEVKKVCVIFDVGRCCHLPLAHAFMLSIRRCCQHQICPGFRPPVSRADESSGCCLCIRYDIRVTPPQWRMSLFSLLTFAIAHQRLFTSPNFYPWFHKRREEGQARIDRAVELGVKR